MLEGSLDVNITKADGDCKCTITGQCLLKECECITFCKDYEKLYKSITESKYYCWYTFNPKPNQLKEELLGYEYYVKQVFKDLYQDLISNKGVANFILVSELSEAGKLHFHILISLKDRIKFYKTFVASYYHKGVNKCIMNQKPKMGMHYLFKQQIFMAEYWEKNSIYTRYI